MHHRPTQPPLGFGQIRLKLCCCCSEKTSRVAYLVLPKREREKREEGRGSWSLCLSCICLLAMRTLICVTFSLPPGVGGWLRLLFVALPWLFCLPFCPTCRSSGQVRCLARSDLLVTRSVLLQITLNEVIMTGKYCQC